MILSIIAQLRLILKFERIVGPMEATETSKHLALNVSLLTCPKGLR